MTTSQIPGANLSYPELLKAVERDDVREAWSQISAVADALGLTTTVSNGVSPRSATTGELVKALGEVLPEGVRIEDVMASTATVTKRTHTTVYEVRNLASNGKWILTGEYADEGEALTTRAAQVETGQVTIVVEVHSVVERDAIDRAAWR